LVLIAELSFKTGLALETWNPKTYEKFKKEKDHIEWITKHLQSHEEKDKWSH